MDLVGRRIESSVRIPPPSSSPRYRQSAFHSHHARSTALRSLEHEGGLPLDRLAHATIGAEDHLPRRADRIALGMAGGIEERLDLGTGPHGGTLLRTPDT